MTAPSALGLRFHVRRGVLTVDERAFLVYCISKWCRLYYGRLPW